MRKVSPLLLAALAAACTDRVTSTTGTRLAPIVTTSAQRSESVPNEYIVVLKPGANLEAVVASARAAGARVTDTWNVALLGFAAQATPAALTAVRADPAIAYVEPNYLMHVDAVQQCAPYSTCSWGLDRIDETNLPMDGTYTEPTQSPNQGASVHAYDIDSGMRISHTQFGGRASYGFNALNPLSPPSDGNGHGTHTAGTIGGASYGVAKRVQLVAVKVCNALGICPNNAIISGVNWVTANAIHPAVANMSLGGSASAAIDQAVSNSIAAGVVYSISAGNSNADACTQSPARVPAAITVAASGNGSGVPPAAIDSRASYSNFGTCVDLFAPGTNIKSAWNGSNTATRIISGTSMAAPHVTGAAALHLDSSPNDTPAQVAAALVARATAGVITNAGVGSPNLLLNVYSPPRP